jgi:cytochrome c556
MTIRFGAALLAACLVASCDAKTAPAAYHGDDALPNGMTVKEQIEARQHNLKDLGGAFKAVNNQLKTPTPQLEEIKLATQEIAAHSQEIANWFPAGTGPDAGVKTAARADIWTDAATFKADAEAFAAIAAKLNATAQAGDFPALGEDAKATGAACKKCHDAFKTEDK